MYLVVGAAMLAGIVVLYLVPSGPNPAMIFLKSRPLPLVVLLALTAIFTGWLRARDPKLRAGLFFKSFGNGLIVLAVSSVLLFDLPSAVSVSAFFLGFSPSVIGTMQFRAARRLKTDQVPNQKRPPLIV
jgi:hypothetical protein